MSTTEHEPATDLTRFEDGTTVPMETLLADVGSWKEGTLQGLLRSGDGTGLRGSPAETLRASIREALENKGIHLTVGSNAKGPVLEVRGDVTGVLAQRVIQRWAGLNGFDGGTENKIGGPA